MIMQRSSESLSESFFNRPAYSRAAAGSWREQGPQMTRRRSDRPMMISMASLRPWRTVFSEFLVIGISDMSNWGGIKGSWPRTICSSIVSSALRLNQRIGGVN